MNANPIRSSSRPQRDRHAPHGTHAQQHAAGRAGAPGPHVGQERLLGPGHGPRVDRHRGQGRGHAARKGIEKSSLSREEFLRYAWEWKEKYGGVILKQLRKLGASCDWDRTCFTMDDARTESVLRVFCDLYDKGKIYRGVRMVNWDPRHRLPSRTRRSSSRSRTASSTTCATRSKAPTA